MSGTADGSTPRGLTKDRVRRLNDAPVREGAKYVLYWSQMNRRVDSNHALAYAIHLGNKLDVPVLVYERLTSTYRGANDRLHTFVLEGVPDTRESLDKLGVGYCFDLRRKAGDQDRALDDLAAEAAAVVTDDYPARLAALHDDAVVAADRGVAVFAVDSSCIVPWTRFEKREWAAYTIRPKIHRMLGDYLEPLTLPEVRRRWAEARPEVHTEVTASDIAGLVSECAIDHSVAPSTTYRGGSKEANRRWHEFLKTRFKRYADDRNHPSRHATSDMSPYLHFGQISSLQLALEASGVAKTTGISADEYLEELIVRRELAFNFAWFGGEIDRLDVLPEWALKTLGKHDGDEREHRYTAEQLERGQTHDPLWNATQKEMLYRGKIHGYYRMYWGKKIIEWTGSHAEALQFMLDIHDRYALDGRDPATYTNVLWLFGLHDRPWTERPIFGQIRYMGFEGMKRKTDINGYMSEIGYLELHGKDPFPV